MSIGSQSPQGIASFPGISQLLEASISLTHGISPSVASLTIAPQVNFTNEVGVLSFAFGGGSIAFPDCKVDYTSFQRNSSGEVWRLSIFDRRWRWRFGQISGTYNVWRDNFTLKRGENGTIDTERTPQQLATLCLLAMGESDFDVADMPNDPRPSVEWDLEVPAQALAALCDELGCRVVLKLDNRVAIRRVGFGAELPPGETLENGLTVDPPERPDAIAVIGGPHRFQVDFQLEAVGLEEGDPQSADTLKPIDALSYKPTGGWSRVDLPFFHQVNAKFKDLARRSVFRYYRIKTPVAVPGYEGPNGNLVSQLEQLLPIEEEQVVLATENGQPANRPALVFGVWFPDGESMANSVPSLKPAPNPAQSDAGAALGSIYEGPYTIDTARGLVIFDELVYRNTHPSATGGTGYEVVPGPAQMVLRAACNVRDVASQALARYERVRQTGSQLGTATRYLNHDEIVRAHVPSYSDSYTLQSVSTNQADADAMADYYLDVASLDYQTRLPQTVRYAGLVPIELDGAIHQLGFHVGSSGATTTAARHNEMSRAVLSYRDRRRLEQLRELERERDRTRPRQLARTLKASVESKPRPRM